MLSNDLIGTFTIVAAANVLDKPDEDDEDKWTNAVCKELAVEVDVMVKAYSKEVLKS